MFSTQNSTPDFLLNNNFNFFNNNANIPTPLSNNRLPYTNKFNNNKENNLNNSNNNIVNNCNNSNNNIDYDVPTLSPQINTVELYSPTPNVQQTPTITTIQQQSKTTEITSVPQFPQYCSLKKCELCERGQPALLLKTPTWSSIMRVVFFTLHNEYPEKQYFSLKTEVYEFMTSHWEKLCINRKRTDNWRKQIQDMLSHSKNVFESGLEKLKQNGFWKLRNIVDPWVINENNNKSSSSSTPSTPSTPIDSQSPIFNSSNNKKKRSFDLVDINNINDCNNNNNCNNKKFKTPVSSPSLTPISICEQPTFEIDSIDQIFGKEIQSIRNETKKLLQLIPTMKYDQSLTKELLSSIQSKLSHYESRLNQLEKDKESFKILPYSPFPKSTPITTSNNNNKFNINISPIIISEPSSPSQQIPSSPSQSINCSRSTSPIPSPRKLYNYNNNNNNCNNSNSQKLFFV